MRALVMVVLVACAGTKAPPKPVSNATPVVAAPEPPPDPGSCAGHDKGSALAKMCMFREHMCECRDKACADRVNEDFTRWMEDMAKNASDERATATTEEAAKAMADAAVAYQECYTKLFQTP